MTMALSGLGWAALLAGDAARATAWLEEGLALCDAWEAGDIWQRGKLLRGLGLAAWRRGEATVAIDRVRASLAHSRARGQRPGVAGCLETLALMAAECTPQPAGARRVARLLGAAEAIRSAASAPLPPVERPGHEATAEIARAALGEADFAAAWAEGAALTLEAAVTEALAEEPTD